MRRAAGRKGTESLRVGIWGCGRAGSALARAIAARRGAVRLAGVLSRSRGRAAGLARRLPGAVAFRDPAGLAAGCDVVLLCVPDGALPDAAETLAATGTLKGLSVLHVSGALDSRVLEPARRAGASVGSLHPLIPLASGRPGAELLAGGWFAPGGRGRALVSGRRIVSHLGGSLLKVPDHARPAYHLAATIIANHSTVLSALAHDVLEQAGLGGPKVRAAFASLLHATARNIEEMGPRRALTGPASRADEETLLRHLELLKEGPQGLARIYRLLSEAGLELAVRRGDLSAARASQVKRVVRARRSSR